MGKEIICNETGCIEDPIRLVIRKGSCIRYCQKHFEEYYNKDFPYQFEKITDEKEEIIDERIF